MNARAVKPYIVRGERLSDVFDRATGKRIGIVFRCYSGDWEVQIDGEPYWWVRHHDCATALDALWQYYLEKGRTND